MPTAASITVEVLVKAWSIYESKQNNWISHFLEHMFFKWWKQFPTAKHVSQAIEELGWEMNAFTWDEYAGYYVKIAPMYWQTAIDVLSDMLINPQFPKEEVEKEKGVVIEEIKMYEDMPQRKAYDKWKLYYYGDNSFGWDVIWTEERVSAFTQEDLFRHHTELYAKDNLIISIAWNISDVSALEDYLATKFSQMNEKAQRHFKPFDWSLPSQTYKTWEQKTQQAHMILSRPWYDTKASQKYAARLLGIMLWWNMSSILFQEIREKLGICYYISAGHSAGTYDGVYQIRVGLQKSRMEEWLKAINEVMSQLSQGQHLEDFSKAKTYVLWSLAMWLETTDQIADYYGEQLLLKDEIKTLEQISKEFEKVQLEDVKALLTDMNPKNWLTCGIV